MSAPGRLASSEILVVVILFAASATLLLANLDGRYLWQDEAQTALVSRTILDGGIPRGSDGLNYFSQELGIEYGEGHVWRWHTWLTFYLVAASYALFGATTTATRLPFALFGIGTVVLTYFAGRALFRDRRSAAAAAGLLSLSVPFLLLSRQGRWYSVAAFFALLGLTAYTRIRPGTRRPAVLLFIAGTLLFHTHYIYVATLLATVLLHALFVERDRLRMTTVAAGAVTLLASPWIVWYAGIPYAERYAGRLFDPAQSLATAERFTGLLFEHLASPLFLAIPIGLAIERWARRRPVFALSAIDRSSVLLLLGFCVVNVVVVALVSPGGFFRYLAPLVPAVFLLAGRVVAALAGRSWVLAALVVSAWLALGSMRDFVYEITHDFDGPIEGIVEFLQQNARPGDTVAMTYGDLPVKFYTSLRVVGGLTGEDIGEASTARWVIPRLSARSPEKKRVRDALIAVLSPETHTMHHLDAPDIAYENREDPGLHRYRTAPDSVPRVVVYRRKR